MTLYAREIVTGWAELYPQDSIIVVGPAWLGADRPWPRVLNWSSSTVVSRFVGHTIVTPTVATAYRADAILALGPLVSPFLRPCPRFSVLHDWRHIRRPQEFSRSQLLYRNLWRISAARASGLIAISAKTARETTEIVGRQPTIVPSGRDHARRWKVCEEVSKFGFLTFGHHTNKRPGLVMNAYAQLPETVRLSHHLKVLGLETPPPLLSPGALACLARGEIELLGFVDDQRYREAIASAACVVLASSDEGYGLPLAEADYLGASAVVTIDSGVADLHPDAVATAPNAGSLAAGMLAGVTRNVMPAMGVRSWDDVVHEIRRHIKDTLAGV